jgi:hypothetical protein
MLRYTTFGENAFTKISILLRIFIDHLSYSQNFNLFTKTILFVCKVPLNFLAALKMQAR